MEPAIALDNVSFSYTRHPVLDEVTLTVPKGDFAMVVGPNGGGKTTLIKLILGLLAPTSGRVTLFGKTPESAWNQIGYMPQYTHVDMAFPVSVLDVVLMGRLTRKRRWRYTKNDREAARHALSEVGLTDKEQKPFSSLSGGQRQRVLIARALCSNPSLLLMDEPTANVDPAAEATLFELLSTLNSRMTILVVSHDLGFVSKVVKSVICVNKKVLVHPTSNLDGTLINEIYGGDLRMVRHDHRCSHEGHCINESLTLPTSFMPHPKKP
ncbi:metal ABC transporter ATP-binding protein [Desulfoluna spongiiphila]|uniref:Zinc transport system ATP-binding protein n=1 Tax=Desulfoluna spongiiphila TaxID=419481 RepID=A0A1G5ACB1_9BACT|nr:metal ABC transporter ATP-binding protein [Desulfoluna spongiiphila]SCX75509.1 zinc transport system ATP-binding protein [Desulfoluna spongiiphila]